MANMEEELNWLDKKSLNQNQENGNSATCKIIVDQDESSISSNEYGASNEGWFNNCYSFY